MALVNEWVGGAARAIERRLLAPAGHGAEVAVETLVKAAELKGDTLSVSSAAQALLATSGEHAPLVRHAPTLQPTREGLLGTDVVALADQDLAFRMRSPKARSYFVEAAAAVGFDRLPTVATKAEIDAAVADGERELFRGLSGDQAAAYAEQFRTGALHGGTIGTSVSGVGTYAAYGPNGVSVADHFARGGVIMRMTLKRDARVITAEALRQMQKAESRTLPPALQGDLGLYAIHKGYDAFEIPEQNYLAILNRTALRVQDTPHPKPFFMPGMRRS